MRHNREIQGLVRFILDKVERTRSVVDMVVRVRRYLVGMALEGALQEVDFYKITSLLTPQSRSPMWEKYFIGKHGCRKVSKEENRGDLERDGRYYEYKVSGFNQRNELNIVQIRLWQECDYIIQSISDRGAITFCLTHSQMTRETIRCSANSAHGTKSVVAVNERNELRMTIPIGSAHWRRWVFEYAKSEPFD